MDSIVLKGRLKLHSVVYAAITKAENAVKAVPKHELLKLSTDITRIVGQIIENDIPTKCDVDKKAITTQILADIHGLSDEDKQIIGEQIDYLRSIGKIKKMSNFKYIRKLLYFTLKDFFLKEKL